MQFSKMSLYVARTHCWRSQSSLGSPQKDKLTLRHRHAQLFVMAVYLIRKVIAILQSDSELLFMVNFIWVWPCVQKNGLILHRDLNTQRSFSFSVRYHFHYFMEIWSASTCIHHPTQTSHMELTKTSCEYKCLSRRNCRRGDKWYGTNKILKGIE